MGSVSKGTTILMVDDDPYDYCLVKNAMLETGLLNDFIFLTDQ